MGNCYIALKRPMGKEKFGIKTCKATYVGSDSRHAQKAEEQDVANKKWNREPRVPSLWDRDKRFHHNKSNGRFLLCDSCSKLDI